MAGSKLSLSYCNGKDEHFLLSSWKNKSVAWFCVVAHVAAAIDKYNTYTLGCTSIDEALSKNYPNVQ